MLTFFASLQPIKNLLSSHDKTHERELRDKILPNFLAGSGQEAGRRPRPRPRRPPTSLRSPPPRTHTAAAQVGFSNVFSSGAIIYWRPHIFSSASILTSLRSANQGHLKIRPPMAELGHKVKNFTQYNRPPFYITYFIRTKRCQCSAVQAGCGNGWLHCEHNRSGWTLLRCCIYQPEGGKKNF